MTSQYLAKHIFKPIIRTFSIHVALPPVGIDTRVTRVTRTSLSYRVFRVILSGNPGISGSIIRQFNELFGNFDRFLAIFCNFWSSIFYIFLKMAFF